MVFGGGIAENTPLVRKGVCDGLRWRGLEMDEELNARVIDVEGTISSGQSPIKAYVIPTQETLEVARECCQAFEFSTAQK